MLNNLLENQLEASSKIKNNKFLVIANEKLKEFNSYKDAFDYATNFDEYKLYELAEERIDPYNSKKFI